MMGRKEGLGERGGGILARSKGKVSRDNGEGKVLRKKEGEVEGERAWLSQGGRRGWLAGCW